MSLVRVKEFLTRSLVVSLSVPALVLSLNFGPITTNCVSDSLYLNRENLTLVPGGSHDNTPSHHGNVNKNRGSKSTLLGRDLAKLGSNGANIVITHGVTNSIPNVGVHSKDVLKGVEDEVSSRDADRVALEVQVLTATACVTEGLTKHILGAVEEV